MQRTLRSHRGLGGGLDRQLVLVLDLLSDEDVAIARIPRLRLPTNCGIIGPYRRTVPPFPALNRTLGGGEALERHRDCEFDLQRVRSSDYGFIEEGAVDAGPDLRGVAGGRGGRHPNGPVAARLWTTRPAPAGTARLPQSCL